MDKNLLFSENQKFTQWWLWALILGVALIVTYTTVSSWNLSCFVSGSSSGVSKEGNGNFPWIDLFAILILLLVCLLFWIMRLKTIITNQEIKVQYFPFFKKRYAWDTIENARVVKYGFVGYGIRISIKYGIVFNINGNMGLALTFKNGKKRLIGTQKSELLKKAIKDFLD